MIANFSDQQTKNDSPFVLSDMSPDTFQILLQFLYTNCASLSTKNAIDVLGCGVEYGLEDLTKVISTNYGGFGERE